MKQLHTLFLLLFTTILMHTTQEYSNNYYSNNGYITNFSEPTDDNSYRFTITAGARRVHYSTAPHPKGIVLTNGKQCLLCPTQEVLNKILYEYGVGQECPFGRIHDPLSGQICICIEQRRKQEIHQDVCRRIYEEGERLKREEQAAHEATLRAQQEAAEKEKIAQRERTQLQEITTLYTKHQTNPVPHYVKQYNRYEKRIAALNAMLDNNRIICKTETFAITQAVNQELQKRSI